MKVLAFSLLLLSAAVAKGLADAEGNSTIAFPKLLSAMVRKMKNTDTEKEKTPSEQIPEIFLQYDDDADGFISAAEFVTHVDVPEEVIPEEYEVFVRWIIMHFDFSSDGKINYEEFLFLFESGIIEEK